MWQFGDYMRQLGLVKFGYVTLEKKYRKLANTLLKHILRCLILCLSIYLFLICIVIFVLLVGCVFFLLIFHSLRLCVAETE